VGQLNYLAVTTRPDIAFYASCLAAFNADPSIDHLAAAQRTLRYLLSTPDLGIIYRRALDPVYPDFHGFSDSDWGGCVATRRSVTGNILSFNGSPFDWVSSKQHVVSLSSNEAELNSISTLASSIVYLKDFLASIGLNIGPFPVHTDNQPAMHYLQGTSVGRIKHAAMRLFFVRDLCSSSVLDVSYIPSAQQPADVLTKPMSRQKFFDSRSKIPMG
jgi:hypothetical protein